MLRSVSSLTLTRFYSSHSLTTDTATDTATDIGSGCDQQQTVNKNMQLIEQLQTALERSNTAAFIESMDIPPTAIDETSMTLLDALEQMCNIVTRYNAGNYSAAVTIMRSFCERSPDHEIQQISNLGYPLQNRIITLFSAFDANAIGTTTENVVSLNGIRTDTTGDRTVAYIRLPTDIGITQIDPIIKPYPNGLIVCCRLTLLDDLDTFIAECLGDIELL